MSMTASPRTTPLGGLPGRGAGRLLGRWRSGARRNSYVQPRSEASLARYDRMLAEEASVADVPADLLRAICWLASGWRQFEPGGRVLSTPSPQGTCFGCMQLNDVWHPDAFPSAMNDAQASIRYAAHLMRWLYEQTGSWDRATIAFFGHDRRAELSARRVQKFVSSRPWSAHGVGSDDAAALSPRASGM